MISRLADTGTDAGKNNVGFMSNYLLGNLDGCLDLLVSTGRLPEAAFFARTRLPSRLSEVGFLELVSVRVDDNSSLFTGSRSLEESCVRNE